jgi:hypothetical protein
MKPYVSMDIATLQEHTFPQQTPTIYSEWGKPLGRGQNITLKFLKHRKACKSF